MAFRYGRIKTKCTWKILVLIPIDNGGFIVIGIVKVLWKAFRGVINW